MHVCLDGVPRTPYLTQKELTSFLRRIPAHLGMTRIDPEGGPYVYPVPWGWTGIVILAESHVKVEYLHLRTETVYEPNTGEIELPSPWLFAEAFTCRALDLRRTERLFRAGLRYSVTHRATLPRGLEYVPAPVQSALPMAVGGEAHERPSR